ncbi:MAG: hypothetical protein ACI814_003750 [Mariniblastus sp.]|jgi:hypothetical protein
MRSRTCVCFQCLDLPFRLGNHCRYPVVSLYKRQALGSINTHLLHDMTAYHENFLPIFLLGCVIAVVASLFAGRISGCVWPGVLLIIGVLAFWSGVFIGSDMGYRAWQSMPDPPEEAFSDASVVGALVFGWLPGGMLCLTVFGLVRGIIWLLHWANPDVFPKETKRVQPPIETGNPYQGPNAG